ncbi:GNAT family N-acetyltransferase [Ahniella affigens]|uniref:GNAT family N-acetyltransferase n=1 Tax=Ahniella affigens TaxID=2021234 RepID=A0A2P1PNJ0_9GAMM|nr:GNAT family N-acetyltransferase [Ahniella affigens]AVP96395.1 GNAT family N-acetyltransferase [Ahniella affigens]
MSTITVRHLEPADLPQIHALYGELQAYGDTLQLPYQPLSHWAQKLDPTRDGFYCLVAERAGEILGQLGLDLFRHPRRKHVATIGMGVKSTARRLGVGSALLSAAIDSCERWMNVRRIEIEVYTDNKAAIALYQKHGFVIEGTCRNYAYRDGRYVDAHVMARVTD